ncbi:hypothetical protein AKJ52_02260 [candidate division MSBL1 archaeon SCGC-AAA382C18]|uniref:MoaB/Mog domain-containing protein n=1 Tax=candidate division MSBL1 archaeon SCGC-AAA382C18 TaxID=1698281 RepID=A0A133VIZ3_9EURY|nr:hypothetical protein AKJ52_02260 [candidate division MSBL1 archaeon SCGC-AAA382C18]
MVNSEILTVGEEILEGTQVNTNASWIAETLTETGIKVRRITTVGDETKAISDEIERSVEKNTDLLIVTGGLGPTPDDKTLDGLSKALDDECEVNETALEMIRESYDKFAEEGLIKEGGITPSRKKMAIIPSSSEPIPNPIGGAPAILAKKNETSIFCLPGVPREMKAILKENIDRWGLDLKGKDTFLEVEITGLEESSMTPLYRELGEEYQEIEVRSYPESDDEGPFLRVKIYGGDENYLGRVEESFRDLLRDKESVEIRSSEIISVDT